MPFFLAQHMLIPIWNRFKQFSSVESISAAVAGGITIAAAFVDLVVEITDILVQAFHFLGKVVT